jgi:hypothetical protein
MTADSSFLEARIARLEALADLEDGKPRRAVPPDASRPADAPPFDAAATAASVRRGTRAIAAPGGDTGMSSAEKRLHAVTDGKRPSSLVKR